MNDKKIPVSRLLFLLVGEMAVATVTVLIYALLGRFSYRVITGLVLGNAVALSSFAILCISVNRAVDAAMAERGEGVLDEESAAQFAAQHAARVNKAVQLSHIGRTLGMVIVLVVAFLLDRFDVVATLVPPVAFQPLLMISGLIFKEG